jgi:3-oxoadipate enol-lactonase
MIRLTTMRLEWQGHAADIRELGNGPPVLLLHGYPLDGAMWSGVARALAPNLQILKPDLPGHGENEAPAPRSLEEHADFLEALLAALPGPVGLAAFSMGGYVALALMKRRPEKVRALALVDTRAGADDEAGRAKRNEAIATVRAEGVAPIAQAMLGKLLSPEGLKKADLVERASRIMTRQKAETVEADLVGMRDRPDQTASLSSIAVPTLVVVGELDVLTPPSEAQAMASGIPGARLVTIPGAGHLAPMERPRAVADALRAFFEAGPL